MLTDSGTAYYAYSGNVGMMNLVRDVLTYELDHGMTPSTWAWPNVAFASSDGGSLTYQGAHYGDSTGSGDGFGVIQPDKVAEVAVAFLQVLPSTAARRGFVTRRFKRRTFSSITSGREIRPTLHGRFGFTVRPTSPASSTPPMSSRRFGYSTISIRLGLGDTAGYQTARQTVWNWLMAYPLKNNVWSNYFEDVPIQSDTWNTNQLNAAETARYLMQHPESDPNWQTHVRGIISWIETNFGVTGYGATRVAEQLDFKYPMGSHTSRYASLNAQLYELTGDQAALDKAFRSFNWASYMCGSNGVVIDGPQVNHVWWTDGYGDYIKHFLEGLGAVPQWAPPTQSHLLRSTSIVGSIQYNATEIDYTVADTASQETFRLAFTPESISVDGTLLPNLPALTQEGWTYDGTTGALRLRHDSGTVIRVSGSPLTGNLAPTVTLDTPSAGTYTTTSLVLSATAGDPDGVVDHVDFVANGLTVGTATSSPYQMTWAGLAPGNYVLAAAAVDDTVGARTVSTSVAVSVSSPALPSPPTGLTASVAGGTVNLVWTPPTGTAPARYALYRSTTTGFAPGASNLIAQPALPYADVGLGPGPTSIESRPSMRRADRVRLLMRRRRRLRAACLSTKLCIRTVRARVTSPGITTAFANSSCWHLLRLTVPRVANPSRSVAVD